MIASPRTWLGELTKRITEDQTGEFLTALVAITRIGPGKLQINLLADVLADALDLSAV